MNTDLSLWLVPARSQAARLRTRIDDLAARTGRPGFAPHLTLLGDLPVSRDRLQAALHDTGDAAAPEMQVRAIGAEPHYFKSLYLDFGTQPDLNRWRDDILARLRLAPSPFAPHLSLAYGPLEPCEKDEIQRLGDLIGETLRLEALQIVHSNRSLPPEQWRVLSEVPLAARPR
ncbi:2'-5' RNA ligase family protein [Pseudooceanicola algae]|uniref:Uncharacterized protein n=1 Tax=Pseudooceanicola algae TaxID=1537215 RepID=A0A418SIP6_9RHOB|nr:2'-5' RNA ligase family protein [Pseudooceanicola algae]QPM91168.1 hypothetical protein PSAL_024170 [Pseudooceanicola algae]